MWELWRVNTSPFAGLNYGEEESDIVIAGCPLDATNSFFPGTRFAPEYIRRASESLELYSYLQDSPITNKKFYDVGNLFPMGLMPSKSIEIMQDFINNEVLKKGKKAILIGGEHTITLGSLPLIKRCDAIVVFDAHTDLRDEYMGERISHATVMRRVSESVSTSSLIFIGIRAMETEEASYIKKNDIRVYTSRFINSYGPGNVIKRLEDILSTSQSVYLSIDMDVLDPSYAPGVGTPEPLGLDSHTFFKILKPIIEVKSLRGVDVVETNPIMDRGYQTSSLAAKVVLEIIAHQG